MEPIITTGAAAIAATSWFLNKVLGPSAQELGEQLRVYTSSRLDKIFNRSAEIAEGDNLEQIPPAAIVKFVHSASLSEDTKDVTESWAHLLVDMAKGTNAIHPLLIDILGNVSGEGIRFLKELYEPWNGINAEIARRPDPTRYLRRHFCEKYDDVMPSEEAAKQTAIEIIDKPLLMPGRAIECRVPYGKVQPPRRIDGVAEHLSGTSSLVIDSLIRERLIDEFTISLNRNLQSIVISGVLMTTLGMKLMQKTSLADKIDEEK